MNTLSRTCDYSGLRKQRLIFVYLVTKPYRSDPEIKTGILTSPSSCVQGRIQSGDKNKYRFSNKCCIFMLE